MNGPRDESKHQRRRARDREGDASERDREDAPPHESPQ